MLTNNQTRVRVYKMTLLIVCAYVTLSDSIINLLIGG